MTTEKKTNVYADVTDLMGRVEVLYKENTGPRPIHVIAREIKNDWKNPNFGAVPYLNAMFTLNSIKGHYLMDTAEDVVLRFLCNAGQWRGETARRVKKELNAMLKAHDKRSR